MNLNVQLSKRETELVPYLISPRTKKEIANELYRSIRTIENHARNVYKKTEVNCKAGLALWFLINFIKQFNIPADALPKALVTFAFLGLFCSLEFKCKTDTSRATRTLRIEAMRSVRSRKDEYLPLFNVA